MVSGLMDMAKSEASEQAPLAMPENKYPYGLQISLTEEELQKLDVDHSEWKVGETFHLHAFAKVTSISENEREGGEKTCNVCLQITHLAGESEDGEDKEEEHEDGAYSSNEGNNPDLKQHGYLRYGG